MTKILIIDDSKMILEVAKNIIESNLLNTMVTAEIDPVKGMNLLEKEEYHIVILDIIMPTVSGIEVLKWINDQEALNAIKVIMFSSLDKSDALADCFALGAYDFITKPLEEYEFIARIKHAINEYKQSVIIDQNFHEMALKTKELEELNRSLKETQAELIQSERLASIGFLAAGMAHEINNPLGYIKSNLSTLDKSVKDVLGVYEEIKLFALPKYADKVKILEDYIEYDFFKEDVIDMFKDIYQGLKRIEEITFALRHFSKVDSDHIKEPVLLSDIFDNIKILTESRLEGKIDFDVKIGSISPVYGNKADMNVSFMSIVNNGFEAVERKGGLNKGKVSVTISEREDAIEITIIDNGVGMKSEVKRHAFDPFFTTKDVGDGAGLGLATAYNCFVNVMKGILKIESTVGEGTKVTVILPKESW